MAMVNLHSLLHPDRNMKGAIPWEAEVVCKPFKGREENQGRLFDPRPIMQEDARKQLNSLNDKRMTLREFASQNSWLADDFEWGFGSDGVFMHYQAAFYPGRGFPVWIMLDMMPWLIEQPEEVVKKIAIGLENMKGDDEGPRLRAAFLDNIARAKKKSSK